MAKIRTTITIEENLYQELVEMAEREERTTSQQIAYLVRKSKPDIKPSAKCICENGENPDSDSCTNSETEWKCIFCGRTETIRDCVCNHMFYDCPYCGEHLT